jgi:TRAP-type C4-dicarboxylate transport system permease small subunit
MKLDRVVNSGIPIFCGALLVIIVALTFWQIVLRQFFNSGMVWSDEISQFCMTWLTLIGSIWATQNNQHLNTGFRLHKKLNKKQIYLIDAILALVIAIITVVVAYQSAIFSLQRWAMESMSLRWLKLGYVYIVLPLVMLTLCYYYLKSFFKNLSLMFKKE